MWLKPMVSKPETLKPETDTRCHQIPTVIEESLRFMIDS
jgi:hypothetical protein